MMEYKGYIGDVTFDADASIFHGEVINTRDVITFQGQSVDELVSAFHGSVDDYLAFCAVHGEEPDKPFSGQFMTRIPPELHREVSIAARIAGKSLNAWVTEQLEMAVSETADVKKSRKRATPVVKQLTKRSRNVAGRRK
jgi:predicted HicB family RNase H-like nuclease